MMDPRLYLAVWGFSFYPEIMVPIIIFGIIVFILSGCQTVPKPDKQEEKEIKYPHTCLVRSMGGHKVLKCD